MAAVSTTLPAMLQHSMKTITKQPFVLLAIIGVCAALLLDFWDLAFLLTGISGFALMETLQKKAGQRKVSKKVELPRSKNSTKRKPSEEKVPLIPKDQRQFIFQPSVNPIGSPKLTSTGFENEVEELLGQISPTPESDNVIRGVEKIVEQAVLPMIPDAKIKGFACGDMFASKVFGVAIPELEIVINVDEQALFTSLGERMENARIHQGIMKFSMLLKKAAIRACCDYLTQHPSKSVKFRRSAFSGDEHKVTLLVPESAGVCKANIPFDLHVNCATPGNGFALLSDIKQKDPRAQQLALLVRRWARDRAISHASKGGLPPYSWSVLSVNFFHALEGTEGFLTMSIAELFKAFLRVHLFKFDWYAQIQDPYDSTRNVLLTLTSVGRSRVMEELRRAHTICSSDQSLADLLTPWAPDKNSADCNSTGF